MKILLVRMFKKERLAMQFALFMGTLLFVAKNTSERLEYSRKLFKTSKFGPSDIFVKLLMPFVDQNSKIVQL